MKISVKNIGVVKEAQVDLSKKLIVLCGPNNSGKTYIAYTLYGLLKTAHQGIGTYVFPARLNNKFSEEQWEFDLATFTLEDYGLILGGFAADFKSSLPTIFAADPKSDSFQTSEVSFPEYDVAYLTAAMRNAEVNYAHPLSPSKILRLKKTKGESMLRCWIERGEANVDGVLTAEEQTRRRTMLPYFMMFITRGVYFPESFILQTQRTAVNIFSRELSLRRFRMVDRMLKLQEQKDNSDAIAVLREARRYSMPIQDSLLIADDLKELEKSVSPYGKLAEDLESSILKGRLTISKEGDVLFSPNGWSDLKISINLSGSMVNSLSGFVFYLRHLAKEGDFIIFDEPELNLHPDNQIKIARFIAEVANAGFSILVSTHSDYIVHELNNCIMLHGIQDEDFEKLSVAHGYKSSHRLSGEEVQVLLFDNGNDPGAKVVARDVDIGENGFGIETIDASIRNLNAASSDILLMKQMQD